MKRKFVKAFFETIPLAAGLLVVTAKPAPTHLDDYLARYLCFIALFTVWNIFRLTITNLLSKPTLTTKSFWTKGIFIAALALLFIITILLFNHRFEKIAYEIALAIIGMSAFAHRFKQTGHYLLFWILAGLYHTGVGFLSFQMVVFSIEWQTFVFTFAVAMVPLSIALADLIDRVPEPSAVLLRKLLSMSLVLGPVWISLLVFTGHLNNFYLIPMLGLPFAAKISNIKDEQILYATSVFCLFFVGSLAILGLK